MRGKETFYDILNNKYDQLKCKGVLRTADGHVIIIKRLLLLKLIHFSCFPERNKPCQQHYDNNAKVSVGNNMRTGTKIRFKMKYEIRLDGHMMLNYHE